MCVGGVNQDCSPAVGGGHTGGESEFLSKSEPLTGMNRAHVAQAVRAWTTDVLFIMPWELIFVAL